MKNGYNGHRNYNAWNVSLWLNNDESLYRMARGIVRRSFSKEEAAETILRQLQQLDLSSTPDGVKFTKTNILLAIRGEF